MTAELVATSASGLAWTVVYIALIYRGIKDKSYGMPLVPLALNFAWEFVFSIVYPPAVTGIAGIVVNAVWMICDIGIITTYFLYSYRYFQRQYSISKREWMVYSIAAFLVSFGIMLTGGPFFGQFIPYFKHDIFQGAIFIAYLQNLIISVCFLLMIWERKSSEGQSMTIGVFKCIGTGLTVGVYYLFILHKGQAHLMNIIVGFTFLLDIIYITTIFRQLKKEGINPWKRL
ncbi:hypothetical protein CEY12_01450 [Chryseobacterium sp. T16E-39]|uniref:transmembrane-type terpene cyclase n=1 Tax=Chryseobacterium sp. T16E-39 TaxID=2015076 RepID=UPI000B5B41C3|nr:hypothetical protein [Chryseobacterium sp. T16E-39]ASK28852.1 hypothetical protein CEY12_01450 [Chryseobacterium sp. T16E-39]